MVRLLAILVFLAVERIDQWLDSDPDDSSIYRRDAPTINTQARLHADEMTSHAVEITSPVTLDDEDLADRWQEIEAQQPILPRPGVDLRAAMSDLLTLELREQVNFTGCDINRLIELRQRAQRLQDR